MRTSRVRFVFSASCALMMTLSVGAGAEAAGEVAFVATAHYFEHATSDPADVTGSPKAVWQVYRNSRGQLRFDWGEKVLIVDPVARQYLQLDTTSKTVRQRAAWDLERSDDLAAAASPEATPAGRSTITPLGSKRVSGFNATGQRVTQVIEVNSSSVSSVTLETEIWVSTELSVPLLVTTTGSHGRQTRYELVDIRFEEPLDDQFVIPDGYRLVTNEPSPSRRFDARALLELARAD